MSAWTQTNCSMTPCTSTANDSGNFWLNLMEFGTEYEYRYRYRKFLLNLMEFKKNDQTMTFSFFIFWLYSQAIDFKFPYKQWTSKCKTQDRFKIIIMIMILDWQITILKRILFSPNRFWVTSQVRTTSSSLPTLTNVKHASLIQIW